jgi:hypothetical protein
MSRKPIGNRPMTVAERSRRYRDRLKARNAAPAPDPVLGFLTRHPDTVADDIYRRLSPELARGIAVALKGRLWQAGSRPEWQPPTRVTRSANLGWMGR